MNRESFFPELIDPLVRGFSDAERDRIEGRWFYFRGLLVTRLMICWTT